MLAGGAGNKVRDGGAAEAVGRTCVRASGGARETRRARRACSLSLSEAEGASRGGLLYVLGEDSKVSRSQRAGCLLKEVC